MTTLAIAEFFVHPEKAGEFLEMMKGVLPATRDYAGCEGVETYVNEDDIGHVYLVEKWGSRSQHEAYLGWRMENGMAELLEPFATAPPKFSYFDARPEV